MKQMPNSKYQYGRSTPFQNSILGFFLAVSIISFSLSILAQGAAITYQGRLTDAVTAASGLYDFRFTLYDVSTSGNLIAGPVTNSATAVSNGLFTVTIDFGAGAFTGADRWLEIEARPNSGSAFATLSPRQKLTPSPYAFYAENAGSLQNNGVAGLRIQALPNTASISNAVNLVGGSPVNLASGIGATVAGGGVSISGFDFPNEVIADFGTISGGGANKVFSGWGTVGGGWNNTASGSQGTTIAGGYFNAASGDFSTVCAGAYNLASGPAAFVGGGENNTASGFKALVGGGDGNIASADFATIAGGDGNGATATFTTIGGGLANQVTNSFGTIPGGVNNVAGGLYSFAAGHNAQALHQGSFVWADSQNNPFPSTSSDQFNIRAQGGVGIGTGSPRAQWNVDGTSRIDASSTAFSEGLTLNLPTDMSGGGYGGIHFHNTSRGGTYGSSTIRWGIFHNYTPEGGVGGSGLSFVQSNLNTRIYISANGNVGIGTNAPQQKLHVVGNILATGTINGGSDRNIKEHFAPVDPREVLGKVARLPISRWNYKEDAETAHVGPMAQDFYAAFKVGIDDKHISMVDADGVALAAIQGLNQAVEEKETEIQKLKKQNESLEKRVGQMELILKQLAIQK